MSEPRIYKKHFPTKLSAEEVDAKQKEVIKLDNAIDEVTAQKAKANADFNQDLKDKRKASRALRDALANGTAMVEHEVFDRINEELQQIETVSTKTDEILQTRAMTPAERQVQEELPLTTAEDAVEYPKAELLKDPEPSNLHAIIVDGRIFALSELNSSDEGNAWLKEQSTEGAKLAIVDVRAVDVAAVGSYVEFMNEVVVRVLGEDEVAALLAPAEEAEPEAVPNYEPWEAPDEESEETTDAEETSDGQSDDVGLF